MRSYGVIQSNTAADMADFAVLSSFRTSFLRTFRAEHFRTSWLSPPLRPHLLIQTTGNTLKAKITKITDIKRKTTINMYLKQSCAPIPPLQIHCIANMNTTATKILRPALVPQGMKKAASTPRKIVSFAPCAKIFIVEAVDDYTDEEVRSVWSTEEDQRDIQVDVVKNIQHLRGSKSASDGKHKDDKELCARGLEHMKSASSMEQRSNEMKDMIDAILDTQDDMWSTCIDLSAHLATISQKHSKAARARACTLGASDAEYVRRFVRHHSYLTQRSHSEITTTNGNRRTHIASALRRASDLSALSSSSDEDLAPPTLEKRRSTHVLRQSSAKSWARSLRSFSKKTAIPVPRK